MDAHMFELLDEATALAAILGRRRGGSTYAALQDHPQAEDLPFAVFVDEDEQVSCRQPACCKMPLSITVGPTRSSTDNRMFQKGGNRPFAQAA